MPFKAIIFDLDGTLLDTLADIGEAMNRALVVQGFPPHAIDAYRLFVGDGFFKLVSRALPEKHRTDQTIHRCLSVFREDYSRNGCTKTRPYPGIPVMLDTLADQGIRMAVLSNKAHAFTRRYVRQFFPDACFDAILGQRDGVPSKPDPASALEIAQRLGFDPAAFLFLGDSAVDMKTAASAGMFPVGACWGFRPAAELEKGGCRALIRKPEDLPGLLK